MKTKLIFTILFVFFSSLYAEAQLLVKFKEQGIMGRKSKNVKNLSDTYSFNWEFKTNMKITGKKKSDYGVYAMNDLVKTNYDYYAIEYENKAIKKSGVKSLMVLDIKSEVMVIHSEYINQKIGLFIKLKDPSAKHIKEKD